MTVIILLIIIITILKIKIIKIITAIIIMIIKCNNVWCFFHLYNDRKTHFFFFLCSLFLQIWHTHICLQWFLLNYIYIPHDIHTFFSVYAQAPHHISITIHDSRESASNPAPSSSRYRTHVARQAKHLNQLSQLRDQFLLKGMLKCPRI